MDVILTKSLHFAKFIVVGAALGLAGAHPAAATQDTKTYDGVTQNMFDNCIGASFIRCCRCHEK